MRRRYYIHRMWGVRHVRAFAFALLTSLFRDDREKPTEVQLKEFTRILSERN